MEILLSTNSNYLSRIVLIIILIIIVFYDYYVFFRWLMIKEEQERKKRVGGVSETIIFLILFYMFIEIGEKYLGMIGIYVSIIIGALLVRKLDKKTIQKDIEN